MLNLQQPAVPIQGLHSSLDLNAFDAGGLALVKIGDQRIVGMHTQESESFDSGEMAMGLHGRWTDLFIPEGSLSSRCVVHVTRLGDLVVVVGESEMSNPHAYYTKL